LSRWIVTQLANALLDEASAAFIISDYLPALGLAVWNRFMTGPFLPKAAKKLILEKFGGMIIKIVYAFMY